MTVTKLSKAEVRLLTKIKPPKEGAYYWKGWEHSTAKRLVLRGLAKWSDDHHYIWLTPEGVRVLAEHQEA